MVVLIHVHSICIFLLPRHKYSASLQQWQNLCQPPPPIAHRSSKIQRWQSFPGAHGVAPVPAGANVRPTPIPPTPHQVHLSHPASNQKRHKSQCFIIQTMWYNLIQPIQYDPVKYTILSSRQYNKIQPMIPYDPVSPLTWKNHSIPILSCLTASASIFYTTFTSDVPASYFHPPQWTLPPEIFSLPLLLHLLLPSLLRI